MLIFGCMSLLDQIWDICWMKNLEILSLLPYIWVEGGGFLDTGPWVRDALMWMHITMNQHCMWGSWYAICTGYGGLKVIYHIFQIGLLDVTSISNILLTNLYLLSAIMWISWEIIVIWAYIWCISCLAEYWLCTKSRYYITYLKHCLTIPKTIMFANKIV